MAGHKSTPEENLLRQRGEVERNAPALKQLRAALQQTIVIPQFALDEKFMTQLGKFERLGFQLNNESNVRAADGDFGGALDSRLTILNLEISLMRGVGIALVFNNQFMEERARRDFLKLAAKVDAATLKQDVKRLKAMDDGRVPFAQFQETEKALNLAEVGKLFDSGTLSPEWKTKLGTPEGRKNFAEYQSPQRLNSLGRTAPL